MKLYGIVLALSDEVEPEDIELTAYSDKGSIEIQSEGFIDPETFKGLGGNGE